MYLVFEFSLQSERLTLQHFFLILIKLRVKLSAELNIITRCDNMQDVPLIRRIKNKFINYRLQLVELIILVLGMAVAVTVC